MAMLDKAIHAFSFLRIGGMIPIVMGFDLPNPSFRRRPESTTYTIHLQIAEEKSWMPACAGMTLKLPRVTSRVIWHESQPRLLGIT